MTDRIAAALKETHRQIPQAFLVASHWSEQDRSGVILVNRNQDNDRYAIWSVGATGSRYSGFYTSDYSDAMADYNSRLASILASQR